MGMNLIPEVASSIEGWVVIYVDDVLVGANLEVTQAVLAALAGLWHIRRNYEIGWTG